MTLEPWDLFEHKRTDKLTKIAPVAFDLDAALAQAEREPELVRDSNTRGEAQNE